MRRASVLLLLLVVALVSAGCARPGAAPEPGCDGGFVLTPDDMECLPPAEVCELTAAAAIDGRASCGARSGDGKGWLTISASGTGAATLVVTDGAGAVLFDERLHLPREDALRVAGVRGEWRVDATFDSADGAVTVKLYG